MSVAVNSGFKFRGTVINISTKYNELIITRDGYAQSVVYSFADCKKLRKVKKKEHKSWCEYIRTSFSLCNCINKKAYNEEKKNGPCTCITTGNCKVDHEKYTSILNKLTKRHLDEIENRK